jgi:antitoxin CcdA
MKHEPVSPTKRKAVNITINQSLIVEAKALGINLSQVCERGIAAELKAVRAERWKAENRAAIESWNDWIEENGIPLAEYRQF